MQKKIQCHTAAHPSDGWTGIYITTLPSPTLAPLNLCWHFGAEFPKRGCLLWCSPNPLRVPELWKHNSWGSRLAYCAMCWLGWGSSTPFKAVRNFHGKLLWAVEPRGAQEGATIAFDILHILFCQCHNGVCKEETSDADGRGERVLNVFLFSTLTETKNSPTKHYYFWHSKRACLCVWMRALHADDLLG